MRKDLILVESRTAREQYINQLDILDKVKKLVLLPDDVHATTELVADYYEVGIKAINSLMFDHKDELESDGFRVLRSNELTYFVNSFKESANISSKARQLAIFPRRAILRVGMLLRDSPIAKTVRTYLLDTEQENRKEFQRWMQTRLAGKTTRREETDAIKEILLSLVQKQNPESSYLKDSEGPYRTYTQMVNRTLGIKPKQRDKLPRSYLRTIELMEHAIAQIIIQEAAKGTHYKEIFQICKQKCQQIKLVSFLPALPPTTQQLKRGS
jgi:hypothetical protein